MTAVPPPPALDPGDSRPRLARRVREAVMALPAYFDSRTNIEGLGATDLFSLNALLASTIEVKVVETLNRMRSVWDPDDEWALHSFERQAQTFPDVLLRKRHSDGIRTVALGIEPRAGLRAVAPRSRLRGPGEGRVSRSGRPPPIDPGARREPLREGAPLPIGIAIAARGRRKRPPRHRRRPAGAGRS